MRRICSDGRYRSTLITAPVMGWSLARSQCVAVAARAYAVWVLMGPCPVSSGGGSEVGGSYSCCRRMSGSGLPTRLVRSAGLVLSTGLVLSGESGLSGVAAVADLAQASGLMRSSFVKRVSLVTMTWICALT